MWPIRIYYPAASGVTAHAQSGICGLTWIRRNLHQNRKESLVDEQRRATCAACPRLGVNGGLGRVRDGRGARTSQHGQVPGRHVQARARAGEWAGLHLTPASLRPSGGTTPIQCACRRCRSLEQPLARQLLKCTPPRPYWPQTPSILNLPSVFVRLISP